VYHWTPADGVASILRDGVLSRSTLEYRRIHFHGHKFGSEEKEAFLRNFVAVSFKSKLLMMDDWRHEQPVVLAIDTDILATGGTLFVPGNTADRTASLDEIRNSRGQAALTELLGRRGLVGQCEAWVPWHIPSEVIRSVHVPNETLAASVLSQISQGSAGNRQIPVLVAQNMFQTPESAEVHRRVWDSDAEDLPF